MVRLSASGSPREQASDKVAKILSGIRGVSYHYYYPRDSARREVPTSIFMHPFVDYLMLLYQKPCCITLWANDGFQKGFFSSLSPQDSAFLGIVPRLEDACPSRGASVYLPDRRLVSISDCLTIEVLSLFAGRSLGNLSNEALIQLVVPFRDQILDALVAYSDQRYSQAETPAVQLPRAPISTDVRERLIAPLRERLNPLFSRLSLTATFSRHSPELGLLNLIAGIQHYLEPRDRLVKASNTPQVSSEDRCAPQACSFSYSASMVLTTEQRSWIDKHLTFDFGRRRDKIAVPYRDLNPSSLLELPLSEHARAIADTMFMNGIIDFGAPWEVENRSWSRDRSPEEAAQDRARQVVEGIFYKHLEDSRKRRTFFIPVHVGGVPWMALYTFSPSKANLAWNQQYFLYRDVIPALAGAIREAAQYAYAEALSRQLEVALGEVKTDDELIELANHHWQIANRVYPFEVVRMIKCNTRPGQDETFELPGGSTITISLERNLYFSRQVPFGLLHPPLILEHIRNTLNFAKTVRLAGRLSALGAVTHEAINLLTPIDQGVFTLNREIAGASPARDIRTLRREQMDSHNLIERDRLIRPLRIMHIAAESLRTTLQMADVIVNRGPLRKSLCSTNQYDLATVIEDARSLVVFMHQRSPEGVAHPLIAQSLERGVFIIRSGYASSSLLRGIIYELLLNAAKHGKRKLVQGEATIEISIRASIRRESGVQLEIRSPVPAGIAWHTQKDIAIPEDKLLSERFDDTFLFRLHDFAETTQFGPEKGICISTEALVDELEYVSRFSLGPLAILGDDGILYREPLAGSI